MAAALARQRASAEAGARRSALRARVARTFLETAIGVTEQHGVGRPSKAEERGREQLAVLSRAYVSASGEDAVEAWFLGEQCRALCATRGWTDLHEEKAAAVAVSAGGAQHTTPPTADMGGKTYDGANTALMAIYNAWMHVWAKDDTHAGWITAAQLVATARDVLGHTVAFSTAARWLALEKKRCEEGKGVRVKPNLAIMIKALQPPENRGDVAEDLLVTTEPAQTVFGAELIEQLVLRCLSLIDIAGFGADLVSGLAKEIYRESLGEEEDIWIPSPQWCYWFMHAKLGLVPRRITSHSVASPEQVCGKVTKVALLTDLRYRLSCKNACTRSTWTSLRLRGTKAFVTILSWGVMSLGIISSLSTK